MIPNETFNIAYDVNIAFKPVYKTGMINCQFDDIEINGCCYDKDTGSVSACSDEEAQFWSVYLHEVNGPMHCIADCKTYEAARQVEKLLLLVLYTHIQTKSQLRTNLILLAVEEAYSAFLKEDERIAAEPETEFTGHPFTTCTNICVWLKENHFPQAKIVGYFIENNPMAIIGLAEGGHDFLLVDDRYIIDFWYRHVTGAANAAIVIDTTENSIDLAKYGDPKQWEPLPV